MSIQAPLGLNTCLVSLRINIFQFTYVLQKADFLKKMFSIRGTVMNKKRIQRITIRRVCTQIFTVEKLKQLITLHENTALSVSGSHHVSLHFFTPSMWCN